MLIQLTPRPYNTFVPKESAGLLLFRMRNDEPEVLLVHPGGPYWTRKDEGAWMIPKGEIEPGEDPLHAAIREFQEETGLLLGMEAPRHTKDPSEHGRSAIEACARPDAGATPRRARDTAFLPLGTAKHRSGKLVHAWAVEGDADPAAVKSNTFQMEWPPRSGRQQEFPEIDRATFYTLPAARRKILQAESIFLDTLERLLASR